MAQQQPKRPAPLPHAAGQRPPQAHPSQRPPQTRPGHRPPQTYPGQDFGPAQNLYAPPTQRPQQPQMQRPPPQGMRPDFPGSNFRPAHGPGIPPQMGGMHPMQPQLHDPRMVGPRGNVESNNALMRPAYAQNVPIAEDYRRPPLYAAPGEQPPRRPLPPYMTEGQHPGLSKYAPAYPSQTGPHRGPSPLRPPGIRGYTTPAQLTAKALQKGKKRFSKRNKIADDESDTQFEEEFSLRGGLQTFQRLVVVGESGELGAWTGYSWKGVKVPNQHFLRLKHDMEGRLWCINENFEVGKMMKHSYKNLGFLGNLELTDIAFDNSNKLWAINRIGELLAWTGYSWELKEQAGFHKLTAIAFDRKNALWAINATNELAVWDSTHHTWDQKEIPQQVRLLTVDFDAKNVMWALGSAGQLYLLSGNKFVNYGWVSCWKLRDISFRKTIKNITPPAEEE